MLLALHTGFQRHHGGRRQAQGQRQAPGQGEYFIGPAITGAFGAPDVVVPAHGRTQVQARIRGLDGRLGQQGGQAKNYHANRKITSHN